MMVPFVDLRFMHEPIRAELDAAIANVVQSTQFIGGDEVAAFEAEFASAIGVAHAVSVASGTDALVLALRALDIGYGDDVITTPLSFIATAEAIVRVGARPVFADVDSADLNLSPASVVNVLEQYTREGERGFRSPDGRRAAAILAVHLFGAPADVVSLGAIAREHGIALVEDAAQAFGARVGDTSVGAFGDVGCFSFFPTKTLGAMGDGGAVVTQSAQIAERVRELRAHGAVGNEVYERVGYNSRLDAVQAAVLRVKLPHSKRWNKERAAIARQYQDALARIPRLETQSTPRMTDRRVFHQFIVRGGRRWSLADRLRQQGVETRAYYSRLLSDQPALATLASSPVPLREATQAAGDLLALPMYPGLSDDMVKIVVDTIAGIYG
jgi:dTDP-4-amino-4,6-dideoxygalactose transaminase